MTGFLDLVADLGSVVNFGLTIALVVVASAL